MAVVAGSQRPEERREGLIRPDQVKVDHNVPESTKRVFLDKIATEMMPAAETLMEFFLRTFFDASFRALTSTMIIEYRQKHEQGLKPSQGGPSITITKNYEQMAQSLERKIDSLIDQRLLKGPRSSRPTQPAMAPVPSGTKGIPDLVVIRGSATGAAARPKRRPNKPPPGGLGTVAEDRTLSMGSTRTSPATVAAGAYGPIDPVIVRGAAGSNSTRSEGKKSKTDRGKSGVKSLTQKLSRM